MLCQALSPGLTGGSRVQFAVLFACAQVARKLLGGGVGLACGAPSLATPAFHVATSEASGVPGPILGGPGLRGRSVSTYPAPRCHGESGYTAVGGTTSGPMRLRAVVARGRAPSVACDAWLRMCVLRVARGLFSRTAMSPSFAQEDTRRDGNATACYRWRSQVHVTVCLRYFSTAY